MSLDVRLGPRPERAKAPCRPVSWPRTVTQTREVRPVSKTVVPSRVLPGSVTGCAA